MTQVITKSEHIGIIVKVPIRQLWKHEQYSFTPWLNDHLDLLGEKLDLEIISGDTEVPIGDFWCDIVALVGTEKMVIENLFETSDHDHLGKLVTWASDQCAKFAVLIAEDFRDEHITAINWLNENFKDERETSFFAVKLSAIKIGNSKSAPLFEVVAKPDNWRRKSSIQNKKRNISRIGEKYSEFWKIFTSKYNDKLHNIRIQDSTRPYIKKLSGIPRVKYYIGFENGGYPYVDLTIDTKIKKTNDQYFLSLKEHKNELNKVFSNKLEWNQDPSVRYNGITLYFEDKVDLLTIDEKKKYELIDWMIENCKKIEDVFSPYLLQLNEEK